jgi:hypothetical protein
MQYPNGMKRRNPNAMTGADMAAAARAAAPVVTTPPAPTPRPGGSVAGMRRRSAGVLAR